MRVTHLIIFFAFLGFSSKVLSTLHKTWEHLNKHVNFIYKLHPLVVIINRDRGKGRLLLSQARIKQNGDVDLKPWEKIHLFCSGHYSHIATKKSEQLRLTVAPKSKLEQFVSFAYQKFPREELSSILCLSPKFGRIEIPKNVQHCANGKGIMLRVGFNVPAFVKLYEICFDRTENISAIYSSHDLIGTWLLFPENLQLSNFPMSRFTKPELLNFRFPTKPFFTRSQRKIIIATFLQKADFYLRLRDKDADNLLIVPNPLTPPGDFHYLGIKTATYCLENSVPTFISIQKGNLYVIELIGRILAMQSRTKLLKVTSGWFGNLTLPGDEDEEKEIYLDRVVINDKWQKIRPLAKYLYKIYYDPDLKRAIAFITMNNPYFEVTDADFPCPNIMDKFMKEKKVIFSTDPRAGFTICCDVWDLLEILNYLPAMNLSGGILKFDEIHLKFLFDQLKLPRELFQVAD